jgi:hypothetical protein
MTTPASLLVETSLFVLENAYEESEPLGQLLDQKDMLQLFEIKYNCSNLASFRDLLDRKGNKNLDGLQLQYTETDNLEEFKKITQQGAANWKLVGMVAPRYSKQITDYLFELFTDEKRSIVLAGYATMRWRYIFKEKTITLEQYLKQQYQEVEPRLVFESIAIGGAYTDNLELVKKAISLGARNIGAVMRTAVARRAMSIFEAYYQNIDSKKLALCSLQPSSVPELCFLPDLTHSLKVG